MIALQTSNLVTTEGDRMDFGLSKNLHPQIVVTTSPLWQLHGKVHFKGLAVFKLTQNLLSGKDTTPRAFVKYNQQVAEVAISVGANKRLAQNHKRNIWRIKCPYRVF